MNFILDLDGTLLNTQQRHYACYQHIVCSLGYKPLSASDYWECKRKRTSQHELLRQSGIDVANRALVDAFSERWLHLIERPEMLSLDVPLPAVIGVLFRWHAAGKRLVLATLRQSPDALHLQLGELGIRHLLNDIVVSAHLSKGIGKAESVRTWLGDHFDSKNYLWVGDTETDFEAARHLGCKIWLVASGIRTREYLATLNPDFLSDSLADIPEGACEANGQL
jgi:phosphoglycolate phosphatase